MNTECVKDMTRKEINNWNTILYEEHEFNTSRGRKAFYFWDEKIYRTEKWKSGWCKNKHKHWEVLALEIEHRIYMRYSELEYRCAYAVKNFKKMKYYYGDN